jgi:chromosome segregation ATPase
MSQNPNLFLFVGKAIKDEYGREMGKIAAFALTPSGKFDSVFIEQTDGKFVKLSTEHLEFDGTDVTLTSRMKSQSTAFCDQIPLLWRKDQALKELSDKNKISRELYEELHRSFEGALNQLKKEAQALIEEVEKEIDRCTSEVKELNYALVHLELEHEIGKIDEQAYQTAFNIIQENIRRVNSEKTDFEQTSNKLSNMLLGDSSKTEEILKAEAKIEGSTKQLASTSSDVPELPEPPVVVYVKEIGKAGI